MLTTTSVRPGPPATARLLERVRALQGGDPLAAVTVVTSTHAAGLHLRRRLAATSFAGVRFTILPRLAEMLGGRRLAAAGLTPLTAVTRAALVRQALRSTGGPLASSAEQAGLVDLVARLAAEVRERPTADIAGLAEGSATARAATEALAAYHGLRIRHRRYDDVDLLDAAAAAVTEGGESLVDIGALVVHLPGELGPAAQALLRALGSRLSVEVIAVEMEAATPLPRQAAVTIAPGPVEEVLSAVRDAVAALDRPVPMPLHRTAIVYRDEATYGPLLRDTLQGLAIPYSSLGGRPLADTVAARGLLGVIRLRDEDFGRAAVLGWLSGVPHHGGVLRSQARWDEISRAAGVVRGLSQWEQRLELLAESCDHRLEELDRTDADAESARRRSLERDRDDARGIITQLRTIDELTRPPAQPTWAAHVSWALRLREELLVPDGAWAPADRESAQLVDDVVRGLAAAGDVEPHVTVGLFLRALADALDSRRRPEGRLGAGLLIGPHQALAGIDVGRVHVLGVREGAFPAALPVDPLLAGDPLGRRPEHDARELRDWQTALSSGSEVALSAPAADLDGRAAYPSPWLLSELDDPDGTARPSASAVRSGAATHPRLRHLAAGDDDAAAATPLSLAERREQEARRALRAGVPLTAHALALRPELSLGAALRSRRQRWSRELTEYDGNLGSVAAGSPLLTQGLATHVQSASGIQQWASCPFRFLYSRVLGVSGTEEVSDERWWEINAGERGSLVHRILERFIGEVVESGDPAPGRPYSDEHVRRITDIAAEELAEARRRGIAGHDLVWDNEARALATDLRLLLREDAAQRAEGGWRPQHVEQAFGMEGNPSSWPAVEIPLTGGRTMRLRGYIDRIDVGDGTARLVDYKTGRLTPVQANATNLLHGGLRIQLALYALALRTEREARGEPVPEMTSVYWHCTSREGFKTEQLRVDLPVQDAVVRVLHHIDEGVRVGCFPQVPGTFSEHWGQCENCRYCPFDAVCPAGRDTLAAGKSASAAMAPFQVLADLRTQTS